MNAHIQQSGMGWRRRVGDWIEIHNLNNPVNVAGYYLSDRLNNPKRWRIPLDAGDAGTRSGYLFGLTTTKSRVEPQFQLSSNGEPWSSLPDGSPLQTAFIFGVSQLDQRPIPNGSGL